MAVEVDDNFVRVDGKSYAVDKITSVELRSDPVPKNNKYLAWRNATLVLLLFSLMFWALLLLAALTAYLAWKASKNPPLQVHRLFLTLASQEATAWVSTDEAAIVDLRDRIETAMARLSQRGANPLYGRVIGQ